MEIYYPFEMGPYQDEYFEGVFAKYKDLPVEVYGVKGETLQLMEDLEYAKEEYFATAIKEGLAIPVPTVNREEGNSKKRLTLRVGNSLYERVSAYAEKEDFSINTAAISLLERGIAAENAMRLQEKMDEALYKIEKHSDKIWFAVNSINSNHVSSQVKFMEKYDDEFTSYERGDFAWM